MEQQFFAWQSSAYRYVWPPRPAVGPLHSKVAASKIWVCIETVTAYNAFARCQARENLSVTRGKHQKFENSHINYSPKISTFVMYLAPSVDAAKPLELELQIASHLLNRLIQSRRLLRN